MNKRRKIVRGIAVMLLLSGYRMSVNGALEFDLTQYGNQGPLVISAKERNQPGKYQVSLAADDERAERNSPSTAEVKMEFPATSCSRYDRNVKQRHVDYVSKLRAKVCGLIGEPDMQFTYIASNGERVTANSHRYILELKTSDVYVTGLADSDGLAASLARFGSICKAWNNGSQDYKTPIKDGRVRIPNLYNYEKIKEEFEKAFGDIVNDNPGCCFGRCKHKIKLTEGLIKEMLQYITLSLKCDVWFLKTERSFRREGGCLPKSCPEFDKIYRCAYSHETESSELAVIYKEKISSWLGRDLPGRILTLIDMYEAKEGYEKLPPVILIGDTHMNRLYLMTDLIGKGAGYRAVEAQSFITSDAIRSGVFVQPLPDSDENNEIDPGFWDL